MISKSIRVISISLLFCTLLTVNAFSQSSEKLDSVAVLFFENHGNQVTYTFKSQMEFDEFKTLERVSRMNAMTGDSVTVEFKSQRIFISINPELTTGDKLDRLLKFIIRLQGYSFYKLN